ncbi:MAG: AAA family ATPase, partial [Sulfurimonas sp.]|nr:AAA family ATPase [Sulfurimonas sp.]
MLESVLIKNIATYDEVGTTLDNLKKINFIYGANGSGKTTLSNFLATPTDVKFNTCDITWKNESYLSTLVYNKDFRDKNFGKSHIEGVFTLGQATEEEIQEINLKQDSLKTIKQEGQKKKETLDKQTQQLSDKEDEFKESCWKDVYKKYEHDFKEAFTGSMQKQSFRDKLNREVDSNISDLLTLDELRKVAKTIFGQIPQTMSLLNGIVLGDINIIEEKKIWQEKIIGKADVNIARLIQKLNLNDWVNHGKSYIQDDDICPFCQEKTITDDFRKQLESYFDESFLESTKQISTSNQTYISKCDNLINQLEQIELANKNNPDTKLNIDKYSAYLKTLYSQFASNKELLSNKVKEPSRSIELISTKEQLELIQNIIEAANAEIKKHNAIVNNYQTEKRELIASIWKYLTEDYKGSIEAYKKSTNGLKKGIGSLNVEYLAKRKEWEVLNNEIKELTKNVTSVQPTVDEINKILKYYGFLNFEIVPSATEQNQYQIEREDGTLAEATLSEGEITFITFLYFLQLTKGATNKDEISNERILVIDDPISSLDSNVLFVVSTLIKDIIEKIKSDEGNIKQLVVLTHNVY